MTAETLKDPALDFFEEAPFEAFRLASATSAERNPYYCMYVLKVSIGKQ